MGVKSYDEMDAEQRFAFDAGKLAAWKEGNLCGICPYRKAAQDRADKAEAALERSRACDCVPSIVSSKACPKCGRKGVLPQEQLVRIQDELIRSREREEGLRQRLVTMRDDYNAWPGQRARLAAHLKRAIDAALTALLPGGPKTDGDGG